MVVTIVQAATLLIIPVPNRKEEPGTPITMGKNISKNSLNGTL